MNTGTEESRDMSTQEGKSEFKRLLEESHRQLPSLRRGARVRGVVVGRQGEALLLDVGAKTEGIIPPEEWLEGVALPELGEEVDVVVKSAGGKQGLLLSAKEAALRDAWDKIRQAYASGELLPAKVVEKVKGGFRVQIHGVSGFMPASEADVDFVRNPDDLIGQEFEVAVLKLNRKSENLVVSRKQPLIARREAQRKAFFDSAKVGDQVSGVVKQLTDFGAFVDLGGVDALVHITDISWRKLKHPSEALSIGQKVRGQIIKLDPEEGKVSLSLKALQPDPWVGIGKKYEPGMRITGTVRTLLDYGAMVEIEPGVEGMIHRSELLWTKKEVKPSQVLQEGDVVDVVILDVDEEKRRISLSLKEVMENPWETWLAEHPVGSKVKGRIRKVTDFGLFVALNEELDGLVHINNLSWHEPGEEAIRRYHVGDEVECVVLGVDPQRQRISLGIKQLSEDPFEVFLRGCSRGSTVTGKVRALRPGAAVVDLAEGVEAVLPLREVPKGHPELKVGDEVSAKVIDVQRKRRQVTISVRQKALEEEREAVRHYTSRVAQKETLSPLALELKRKLLKKE